MQFDYEIPIEEYTAGHVLYHKARTKGQFLRRGLGWALVGLFFVLVALFRWSANWEPVLLLLAGAWCIYGGLASLFPARHFRRHYAQSSLAGKKYHAEVDESGFSVSGDDCSWRVLWVETQLKGEDSRVFMFSGKGTIFIFGKKYLTDEQQKAIRQFASLP